MTREEASFILANIDRRVCDDELNEALDMAIEALEQEQRTRRWILIHRNGVNMYICSECNNEPLLIGESYPIFKLSDYCPYCGAKMEVEE